MQKTAEEKLNDFSSAFFRLCRANKSYDEGNIFDAGSIAVNVFSLVHDASKKQPSGLTLVERKSRIKFIDTAMPLNPGNLLSETPLTMIRLTDGGMSYHPIKGEFQISGPLPPLSFEKWWNKPVIKTVNGVKFSRKNLIFFFRHERGSHIGKAYSSHGDSTSADFADLARGNPCGWIFSDGANEYIPEFGPEYSSVRQIGWEVEETITQYCSDILNIELLLETKMRKL